MCIRWIRIRIRILNTVQNTHVHSVPDPVTFRDGSGSLDPYLHWNLDHVLFVRGYQDSNKKYAFLFTYYLFTSVFKDNKSLRSEQNSLNQGFLNFLLVDGRIQIRIRTNIYGSGSKRPENLWILRNRTPNTAHTAMIYLVW
jgi:hypothetical protein